MWDKVSHISKAREDIYPLDGQGRAAYQKYKKIPNTYTYALSYNDQNEEVDSNGLFDNRNPWIKSGVKSRIFPTWSCARFYQFFASSLYKVLVKTFWNSQAARISSSIYSPEDYWTDVQLYFINKTRKEQLEYDSLVNMTQSYCHYPLKSSYKDGGEVLNGILTLFHEKIRDIFKTPKSRMEVSLEDLNPKQLSYLSDEQVVDHGLIADETALALSRFKELKKESDLVAFFVFLSIDGSFEKKLKEINKLSDISPYKLRKMEHLLLSRVLPDVWQQYCGDKYTQIFAEEYKKNLHSFIRKLANDWLARQRKKS